MAIWILNGAGFQVFVLDIHYTCSNREFRKKNFYVTFWVCDGVSIKSIFSSFYNLPNDLTKPNNLRDYRYGRPRRFGIINTYLKILNLLDGNYFSCVTNTVFCNNEVNKIQLVAAAAVSCPRRPPPSRHFGPPVRRTCCAHHSAWNDWRQNTKTTLHAWK